MSHPACCQRYRGIKSVTSPAPDCRSVATTSGLRVANQLSKSRRSFLTEGSAPPSSYISTHRKKFGELTLFNASFIRAMRRAEAVSSLDGKETVASTYIETSSFDTRKSGRLA